MPALTAPALVVAALLALAGAQKLLDPTMTVGALRALGLPARSGWVRLGSGAELVLGLAAITVGGALVWSLVGLSYGAFGAFVVLARRSGTMIGSCGCFGRDETPPHPIHVVLDVFLAGVAVAMAGWSSAPPLDALIDAPGVAVVIVALSALALVLVYAAFVDLPRALSVARTAGVSR
ncbi:MAG: hypothetical protein EXQ71_00615 [Acidimicrobiia bacterium]|nr:hypothetical protein [Acidimicrobiia bacterium]